MFNELPVWDTHTMLLALRETRPTPSYWLQMFTNQVNSQNEYINFTVLPYDADVLAPFVEPLAAGEPVYRDSSSAYQFKPAYVKPKDVIDPTAPLIRHAGIDVNMMSESELTPMQRLNQLRLAKIQAHRRAIDRRFEWMACRAIVDGNIVIEGDQYPTARVNFFRDPNHTITLASGSQWGDTGVSIFDFVQKCVDQMNDAHRGAAPTRITLGSRAWAALRKDEEFMKHMDLTIRNPAATVERGLITPERVAKVGEMLVGGASGATIELYRYADRYEGDNGVEVPFIQPTDAIFTAAPASINGYRCFGAIIDPHSGYLPLEIFPRNWRDEGDPSPEYIMHQSAPLMVPLHPNATLKATVVS